MSERENLISEKEKIKKHLWSTRAGWVKHILFKHHGFPSSSCHTCTNKLLGTQVDEFNLREIDQEISQLLD